MVNIFVAVEGGPFGEKTNFRKKVSQCRKTDRGPFGIFKRPICCKISKKLKGDPLVKIFLKKSHNAKKTERGDPLGFSNIHSDENSKKMKGGLFREKKFRKKVSQCRKKLKGGPFGLTRYGMLRGKTGKSFLVHFALPNGAIWCNNIL